MRDIKEMAREVKLPYDFVTGEPINLEKLEAFAALVRADALAEHKPYRLLQDNGSKYFGPSWDKAEQPAQQQPVAYLCENAVGHKYFRWKKPSSTYKPIALYTSPQQPTVPDALTTADKESPEYTEGWNDCRQAMLRAKP